MADNNLTHRPTDPPTPLFGCLEDLVASFDSMLVGFSGGVDSTLLAVVGRQVLGKTNCIAATGISASLSSVQFDQASRLADEFDLTWLPLETSEVDDSRYAANDTNRCFFCKTELWRRLGSAAARRGLAVVADGTNADDVGGHRPGKAAGERAGVRSPLLEAGLTKDDVRAAAHRMGIPNWEAPASPCLSSRIQFGVPVTPARLKQVETGEEILRSVGITGNMRLRHRGFEARIEIEPGQFEALRRSSAPVTAGLHDAGFRLVTLDLDGYCSGSLLRREDAKIEVLSRQE